MSPAVVLMVVFADSVIGPLALAAVALLLTRVPPPPPVDKPVPASVSGSAPRANPFRSRVLLARTVVPAKVSPKAFALPSLSVPPATVIVLPAPVSVAALLPESTTRP